MTKRDLCTSYCAAKFEACDARCALAQVRFPASTLTARDSCAEASKKRIEIDGLWRDTLQLLSRFA